MILRCGQDANNYLGEGGGHFAWSWSTNPIFWVSRGRTKKECSCVTKRYPRWALILGAIWALEIDVYFVSTKPLIINSYRLHAYMHAKKLQQCRCLWYKELRASKWNAVSNHAMRNPEWCRKKSESYKGRMGYGEGLRRCVLGCLSISILRSLSRKELLVSSALLRFSISRFIWSNARFSILRALSRSRFKTSISRSSLRRVSLSIS